MSTEVARSLLLSTFQGRNTPFYGASGLLVETFSNVMYQGMALGIQTWYNVCEMASLLQGKGSGFG